jgi:hypothetical protein
MERCHKYSILEIHKDWVELHSGRIYALGLTPSTPVQNTQTKSTRKNHEFIIVKHKIFLYYRYQEEKK